MLKAIPEDYFDPSKKYIMKLLWEEEWRGLGITQVIDVILPQWNYFADLVNRAWDGNITKYMSQSLTFYYSSK